MAKPTILNAKNIPLNERAGTVPDVSGALNDKLQPMTFSFLTKDVVSFQNDETKEDVSFRGRLDPFTASDLKLLPEGQRQWKWYHLLTDRTLELNNDDRVGYLGAGYRVMDRTDYKLYGFQDYHLIQDWTGSDPT
jgi:hypothetical protein